ncbi:MAG: UDP-3-O-acyl-N-acetylglucosamine deacetylase [Leptolyngbya sp. DLM2.Bin15]|nr:MAG: UDP-3-O-acyl-N-acetylglucosamine deacetylase [Leptolyngbya sp. DLM2.Bin15]
MPEEPPVEIGLGNTHPLTGGLGSPWQHTLATAVEQSGVGLHSGIHTTVRLCPASVHQGRFFVRVDLPGQPVIPARVSALHETQLSTELAIAAATVRTVEHLLAALAGLGVDNVRIEINGPEVPLLDGSARLWVEAIAQAGLACQSAARSCYELDAPLWVQDGDAFVVGMPASELRFTYGIDFDLEAIGNQWQSWSPSQMPFQSAIAPARTFGLADQIEQLQRAGLIKGGSLDNALVCGTQGWINPPLRFSNEPVRHKLLDLVGDISLVGLFPQAHITAYKASHRLHTAFAHQLSSRIDQQSKCTMDG